MTNANAENFVPQEYYDEHSEEEYIPAPCQRRCPLGTDIPSYVGLIAQERFEEAFKVITEKNPFGSVCGRVCAMPCESQCRRGESDGPVTIRNLKRFVTDLVRDGAHLPPVPVRRGKSIGIVGGGPAGLTAAQDLAEEGYEVHIYERSNSLGGMMTQGIPVFRLPRRLIERDIDRILKHCPGISPHLNCALGKHVSLDELKARHDAVLLTIGLWRDRSLGVPGEQPGLKGLLGIGFLTETNAGKPVRLGGNVVVVGGGNVAIDMARTALRSGAAQVELFCLESRDRMPAWDYDVKEAEAEGVIIHPCWGPKSILHEGGRVTGIEFMRCTSVFDANGRFNPAYDNKVTRKVDTQAVLLAIGVSAENQELERLGLMEGGRVKADFETMRTGDAKVFAAGDGAFGPSAIVYAIHHGHRAAHYVKAFLEEQKHPEPYRVCWSTRRVPLIQDPRWEILGREDQSVCAADSLTAECEATYDWDIARRQAVRCLRCDTETGTSDYSRRTREHIHAMARTEPDDFPRLREILAARLKRRKNPFPPGRPAQLDDLVFLPAALTRLVIDPYREHCSTATPVGGSLTLQQPFIFAGFDEAPDDVRKALASALGSSGCGYMGFRAPEDGGTGKVPWLQLIVPGRDEPRTEADGLVYIIGGRFEPIGAAKVRKDQLTGLSVSAAALPEAVSYALGNGFDMLVLDGTPGVELPQAELGGAPDLTVIRDALRALRKLNREEEIDLLYFGGLRSGTDVAKVLAANCRAGVFGAAMGIAMGGTIEDGRLVFGNGFSSEERRLAAENWIKGTAQETAIIARCTGKTNVHNLEPEDMRTITLATADAMDIPLASGRPPRDYF
jgi:NADPH-dependent glutamate synthase beta subunit-like oxidoreductase